MKLHTLVKYARPRFLLGSRTGYCPLCCARTLFVLTDAPETIRNHAICVRCGSCSRNRHVALCVLQAFADRGIGRLRDFARHPELRVLNTSSGTPIARALGSGANIACSEYFDDRKPGEDKSGIPHQDLTKLTFAADTLDLVVSEDVFEHIPDMQRGFREVHRVLKPGGFHVFSVPFTFDRRTRELFERRGDEYALVEPVEYHGDPARGRIACYTHFGFDFPDLLGAIGFGARFVISQFADETRFGTFDSYTFVTRKLAASDPG